MKQPSRTDKDYRREDADRFARAAIRDLEAAVAMTAGWSRRQLLDVALTLAVCRPEPQYVTPTVKGRTILRTLGNRTTAIEVAWTDENLRAAHVAFNDGHRSPWSIEGERMYQRLSRRRRRAS